MQIKFQWLSGTIGTFPQKSMGYMQKKTSSVSLPVIWRSENRGIQQRIRAAWLATKVIIAGYD